MAFQRYRPSPIVPAPLLHSDRLRTKFGPLTVRLEKQNASLRHAHLVDASGRSRTFAITLFGQGAKKMAIRLPHLAVYRGGLLGESFRRHGFDVRRNVIAVHKVVLNDRLMRAFGSRGKTGELRISEILVRRGNGKPFWYATIAEIVPPVVARNEKKITIPAQTRTIQSLQKTGMGLQEIWDRLGQRDWKGVENRVRRATTASAADEQRLKTLFLSESGVRWA